MKSSIGILIIFFGAAMLIGCAGPSSPGSENADSPEVVVNNLPVMVITLLDGKKVDVHQVKGKTMVIVFKPDCDHCQREATEVATHLKAFGSNTIYFVSSDPLQEIKKFADTYNLSEHPNVFFGWTSVDSVLNNFGPIDVPSIYIYSADQKLVKYFNGEVEISQVLKFS